MKARLETQKDLESAGAAATGYNAVSGVDDGPKTGVANMVSNVVTQMLQNLNLLPSTSAPNPSSCQSGK